jgi:hypothetical protein
MTTESTPTTSSNELEPKVTVDSYRLQKRYKVVTLLSAGLLFSAFLLLLLVALSLPITKTIYLLSVKSTTAVAQEQLTLATELRFGVWGVCATRCVHHSLLGRL